MLSTKQRNKKISHLIESTINDFCKVFGMNYFINDEVILVRYEDEELFYIYLEYNEVSYDININCVVFSDLTVSKTTRLREVHKSSEVADYLRECDSGLWFYDCRMIMSHIESCEYSEFALLKSKLLLDIYINVQNTRRLKDKLEGLVIDMEQVSVN
jgi:hypothetical protein